MKIKNFITRINNYHLFCLIAPFFMFTIIDISVLFIVLKVGMTFSECLNRVVSSFIEADISTKLICTFLLIAPFVLLLFLINLLKIRMKDYTIARNTDEFIKYIDFTKDKLKLVYLNSLTPKELFYTDIDYLNLIIDVGYQYSKTTSIATYTNSTAYINIKSGLSAYSICYSSVNLAKLYKIIYYSQFVKNFSYKFSGDTSKTKKNIKKKINEYIKNDYKISLKEKLCSIDYSIVFIIFFLFMVVNLIILYLCLTH